MSGAAISRSSPGWSTHTETPGKPPPTLGACSPATRPTIPARTPSYDPRLRAALVLAVTGSAAEAEAIVSDLQRSNPDHTFINFVLAPIARAGVEMGRSRPRQAIEQLRIALPYETGLVAALA